MSAHFEVAHPQCEPMARSYSYGTMLFPVVICSSTIKQENKYPVTSGAHWLINFLKNLLPF